jgi:7-carboxy-7-deazaguanine synthase
VSRSVDTLVVSEVFGPTFQGEGPSLGRRAGFVRLGRCNLACTWCDTPYTWDWQRFDPKVELAQRSADDVAAQVEAMRVPLVVVTGGEPLLQQSHLHPLLGRLRETGHEVEVETAGTVAPDDEVTAAVDRFNVSPKLASSGNAAERRYRPDVLRAFVATGKANFKFVATSPADLDEAAYVVRDVGIDARAVWVMPEGTAAATVTQRLGDLAAGVTERGWNLTTRLHVVLWGDQRGR